MDANETTQSLRSPLSLLVDTCNLTDVVTYLNSHLDLTPLPTYIRGSQRIDYAFATTGVLPFIQKTGYDPIHALVTSDHHGIILDVDFAAYLYDPPSSLNALQSRGITSKDPRRIRTYLTIMHKYIQDHKSWARTSKLDQRRLQDLEPNDIAHLHKRMNKLDRDITRAMLSAEKQCRPQFTSPWSPALHHMHKLIRF